MTQISKIVSASDLPDEWDLLAANYFQRKEFLLHCEKYNSCRQRYYILSDNNIFKAGAIVYTLSLDIFTFIGLPSPIKMQINGVPCSVSAAGVFGEIQYVSEIINYIHKNEKGFHLSLNIEECPEIFNSVAGRTLPSIVLKNNFKDWSHYKESLRSDYRRRFLKIKNSFSGIQQKRGTCKNYTDDMYKLYREVLKRSKGKLETLNFEFFKNLPSAFCLTSFYKEEKLIGWYISTNYNREYYFFLGGIDYSVNNKYNTYFNMLSEIVKEGIQKNADFIDLGQTAEIPKMRLGGKVAEKKMIGFHSSKIMNTILKKTCGLLEYKEKLTETNVLKT